MKVSKEFVYGSSEYKKAYDDWKKNRGLDALGERLEWERITRDAYKVLSLEDVLGISEPIKMRPSDNWINGLHDLCKYINKEDTLKTKNLLEIGVFAGESTSVFSDYFNMVFSIDPWSGEGVLNVENWSQGLLEAEKVFDDLMYKKKNIVKLRGLDTEFLDVFADNSLDVVYIDGNHTYEAVKRNIIDWLPKIKLDGFMCGHDFYDVTPGVPKAVKEIFVNPDKTFEDFSWLIDFKMRLSK